MIKIILMDCDGPVIKREKYFSQRLMDLGIALDKEKISDFFHNEFLLCETGKADLKQELAGRIKDWGWKKSLEELLDFWFSGEAAVDREMIGGIGQLRQQGIECHLVTDQEKYRARYLWDVVGLRNTFDGKYSSCDVGFLKSDVRYWEKVYQDFFKYPKEQILVWDDDRQVLDTARDFGFCQELYRNIEGFKIKMNKYYHTQ